MWDGLLTLFRGSLSGTPGAQAGKYLGRNRPVRVWGRCAGDVTGAGATCSVAFEQSDTLGGTYAAIPGVGALVITEQAAITTGTPTNPPAIPAVISPYSGTPLPFVSFTPTKDYVRANVTLGGTSPVFPGVSIDVEPLAAPVLASGR